MWRGLHNMLINAVNAHLQVPKGLFRKELKPLTLAGANACLLESSRFPCSEAVSDHRRQRVDSGHMYQCARYTQYNCRGIQMPNGSDKNWGFDSAQPSKAFASVSAQP